MKRDHKYFKSRSCSNVLYSYNPSLCEEVMVFHVDCWHCSGWHVVWRLLIAIAASPPHLPPWRSIKSPYLPPCLPAITNRYHHPTHQMWISWIHYYTAPLAATHCIATLHCSITSRFKLNFLSMDAELWMISRLAQVTTYGTWDNHWPTITSCCQRQRGINSAC